MSAFYLSGIQKLLNGGIDLDTDTIKVAFMDPSYTPNTNTEDFYDDISASIASGSADQTLTTKALNIDTTNYRVEFDADNISISNETIAGGTDMMVLYKDTGVASTSPLICYIDISEGTLSPVNGTFTITWNAEGIFAIGIGS